MPSARSKGAVSEKKSDSGDKEKKLSALGKMLHAKFKDFDSKVSFVKKRFKGIKKPEALVAAALRAAGVEPRKGSS